MLFSEKKKWAIMLWEGMDEYQMHIAQWIKWGNHAKFAWFHCATIWKEQNYANSNGKLISACQRHGEDWISEAQEIFRMVKLFSMTVI